MPYHHLTAKEQSVFAHMTIAGFSLREIGHGLILSPFRTSPPIERPSPGSVERGNVVLSKQNH